jgi:ferredoxin
MTEKYRFDLDSTNCMFCAACASVAPGHFFVDPKEKVARVSNQPETDEEVSACRAAMINCPASTITETLLT